MCIYAPTYTKWPLLFIKNWVFHAFYSLNFAQNFHFFSGFFNKNFRFFLLKTLQKPIFLFLFFVVFVCFLKISNLKKFFLRLKKNIFKLRKKLFVIKFFNFSLKKILSFHQKLLFQGADFVFSALIFFIISRAHASAHAHTFIIFL